MQASITASANHTLDVLLELVCVNIQLTETQDLRARAHYGAVADWLSRDGSRLQSFDPHIFPQGSQRLGTTTKPIRRSEFDLDAICKLNVRESGIHPGRLYRLLWERLAASGVYSPMMKRLPRCVRLEYSGDFHLDIAPAIPDFSGGQHVILVPDLDANLALEHPENDRWKSTNPTGYVDWFENRCVYPPVFNERYARAQVDPVPEREPIHAKPALKRSVQLFKRWRDVEYGNRQHLAPPSIILTTLSGKFYERQLLCTDALGSILQSIATEIDAGRSLCMMNPAHPSENICEKWEANPAAYSDFTRALTAFRDRWRRLMRLSGLRDIEEELSELFGETPVRSAIEAMAEKQVNHLRQNRGLHVSSKTNGQLSSAAAATGSLLMPKNTFFGDHKN